MKVSCSINAIKPSFNNLLETSATPEDLQMSMSLTRAVTFSLLNISIFSRDTSDSWMVFVLQKLQKRDRLRRGKWPQGGAT